MSRTVEQIQFAPSMPKPLRVAAYARVSSGKDAMLHSLAARWIITAPSSATTRVGSMWAFMQTKPRLAPETAGRTFSGCSPTAVPERSIASSPSPYPAFPGIP